MAYLILGLVLFIGAHAIPTRQSLRDSLVRGMGEVGYKGLMSLVSLAGFVLIAWGFGHYRSQGYIQVWDPPAGLRHLTVLLMLPAMICLVAAYLPGRIKAKLKHPMLAAVKIWALAHLLANGDLGSIILFGALLAWAVYDRISVKRRGVKVATPPEPAVATRNDIIAVVAGTALWGVMIMLHPLLIGVRVFGG